MRSRDYMMEFSKIELKLQPLILKCLEGMEKAAGAIDANLVNNSFSVNKLLEANLKFKKQHIVFEIF